MIDDGFVVEMRIDSLDAWRILEYIDLVIPAIPLLDGDERKIARQVRAHFAKELTRVLNIDSDMCCCGFMQLKEKKYEE